MTAQVRTSTTLITNWSQFVSNPADQMAIVHEVNWKKERVTLEEADPLPSNSTGLWGLFSVYFAQTEDPDVFTVLSLPDSNWCRYLGPNKTRKIKHADIAGELVVSRNELRICSYPGTDAVPDPLGVMETARPADFPPPGVFPTFAGAQNTGGVSVNDFIEPVIGGAVFDGPLVALGAEVHGKQFRTSGAIGYFVWGRFQALRIGFCDFQSLEPGNSGIWASAGHPSSCSTTLNALKCSTSGGGAKSSIAALATRSLL